jgi:outer membrane protein assembly factor BamB
MCTVLATAALSGATLAEPLLFVGGSNGIVMVGSPTTGNFHSAGVCGGAINSMAVYGSQLLLGDTQGVVYRFDPALGFVTSNFSVPGDATAMAVHGDHLLVGTSTGDVHVVDLNTEQVLSTRHVPMGDVRAMSIAGNSLIVGGLTSFVYKAGIESGPFSFLTACGGQVNAMAAGSELLIGTVSGTVYRIDPGNGAYYGTFQGAEAQSGLVMHGAVAITAAPDGTIRRQNATTGAVMATFETSIAARGLALVTPRCLPDMNEDGTLNLADFGAFQTAYALGDMRADMNFDGQLTLSDFGMFQTMFAAGCQR